MNQKQRIINFVQIKKGNLFQTILLDPKNNIHHVFFVSRGKNEGISTKKNVANRVTTFRQSYDGEKCKCRARVFFDRTCHPYISSFPVPFSRGRVPIYLSRIIFPGIVVTTPKNYRFSFDAILLLPSSSSSSSSPPPSISPYPIYICLFQLYRKWICGLCLFPRRIYNAYNYVNAQLQSET